MFVKGLEMDTIQSIQTASHLGISAMVEEPRVSHEEQPRYVHFNRRAFLT